MVSMEVASRSGGAMTVSDCIQHNFV